MTRTILLALACALAFTMSETGSAQPAADPIRYTLRFPEPHTHYVEVEATYPTAGRPEVELFMAVWTPGSYLVREYERHVEAVTAAGPDGQARAVVKTQKNRWRVASAGASTVTVRYRVYGREMTVRNNWIEAGFAMINGAPTFVTLVDRTPRPHEVHVELPAGWKQVESPLARVTGETNTFRAADFDELVDSPMILGTPVVRTFEVAGKTHHLVLEGDASFFDADRAAADAKKIVETAGAVMGRYDYPRYYFQTLLTGAGGGLEHKNSTMLMAGRYATRTRRAYLGWNGLVAHEYFHNWNVKRLRPIELGPFDYEHEVHTKGLWIAEGFTDYYGGLLVRRAGISTRDEYLDDLSNSIASVQHTPGRLVTSVGMASYDAWIKQYRPDENTANTSINYYGKGAVIAFLLDAKIRSTTGGARSLDDGMRLAYERYSGAKGYTLAQFYDTMSEIAGTDLEPWFHQVVDTTSELDYAEALAYYGLRFHTNDTKEPKAWLGVSTRADDGRLIVSQVRRETPGYSAGVNVDDEILAVDDVRVRADELNARLEQYKPGDAVTLLVARRGRLTKLPVTLGAEPGREWRLEVVPDATDAQQQRLKKWLALDGKTPTSRP